MRSSFVTSAFFLHRLFNRLNDSNLIELILNLSLSRFSVCASDYNSGVLFFFFKKANSMPSVERVTLIRFLS